jgi:hypothetical protein
VALRLGLYGHRRCAAGAYVRGALSGVVRPYAGGA